MALKFIPGKAEWLFLDNDTNGTIDQTQGITKLSLDFLRNLQSRHLVRYALGRLSGFDYFHIIAPNKETSLQYLLPDSIKYESFGPTPVKQYISHLKQNFSDKSTLLKNVYYDPSILSRSDQDLQYYYKTDTHWTYYGAMTYIISAMRHFDLNDAVDVMTGLRFDRREGQLHGDLGRVAGVLPENIEELRIAKLEHLVLFAGAIPNEGYMRHTTNSGEKSLQKRVIVIHDSFTQWLYDLFAETFKEVLFIHCPDIDIAYIASVKPDILLFVQVERFLPRLVTNELSIAEFFSTKAREKSIADRSFEHLPAW